MSKATKLVVWLTVASVLLFTVGAVFEGWKAGDSILLVVYSVIAIIKAVCAFVDWVD